MASFVGVFLLEREGRMSGVAPQLDCRTGDQEHQNWGRAMVTKQRISTLFLLVTQKKSGVAGLQRNEILRKIGNF